MEEAWQMDEEIDTERVIPKKRSNGRQVSKSEVIDIMRTLDTMDISDTRKRKPTAQYSPEKRKIDAIRRSNKNNNNKVAIQIIDSSQEDETDESNETPRLMTPSEEALDSQINCAVLAAKLEARDEIVTLRMQLTQMKEKYDRIARKLNEAKAEIQELRQTSTVSKVKSMNTVNEKNIRHLYRHIDGDALDARIASLVYWNERGQLVVPIRGYYRLGDLIHLFTDQSSDSYEPGLLDAMLFLEGNCNLFVPFTYEYLTQLGHSHLFNATQAQCLVFEPESYANLFNQRNILQNLIMLDILQYCFTHSRKRLYAPELLSQPKLTNMIAAIAELELLPLQPCHLTMAFLIPLKPVSPNLPGDKKSCTYCGSSASIEHHKKGELPGKRLRNHTKKCALQLLVARDTTLPPIERSVIIDEMIDQLNEFDAIYVRCHIKSELTRRYYKFFGHSAAVSVPEKFTSALIDSEGHPYQMTRLRNAIERISQSIVPVDYSTNLNHYKECQRGDIACLSYMMGGSLFTADLLRQRVYGSPNDLTGVRTYTQSVAYMMSTSPQPAYSPQPMIQFEPIVPQMEIESHSHSNNSVITLSNDTETEVSNFDPCVIYMNSLI